MPLARRLATRLRVVAKAETNEIPRVVALDLQLARQHPFGHNVVNLVGGLAIAVLADAVVSFRYFLVQLLIHRSIFHRLSRCRNLWNKACLG